MLSPKFEKMCNSLTHICNNSDLSSLHSSCLFKGKKILSSSNNYSRSRMEGMNFPSIHSEVSTIMKFHKQMFKSRFLCKNKSSVSIRFNNTQKQHEQKQYQRSKGKLSPCIL
jgi:hypothetical protein